MDFEETERIQTRSKELPKTPSVTDDEKYFINEQLRNIARSNSQTESEKMQALEWEENQKIYHRRRKEYDEEVLKK